MAQMMEDLEVSRATVNRDLEFLRDQLHAPIVWDRDSGVYRLEAQNHAGPAYMLSGLWLTPQQAYAFLTMQNMVEKIVPNLLGPFLDPMRGLLKEMLGRADFQLYGLDRKIEIDMPAMPALGDLDFTNLLEALLHGQPVHLTLRAPGGNEASLNGIPEKLRISPEKWVVDFRPESGGKPLTMDVGQIRKVVLISEEEADNE